MSDTLKAESRKADRDEKADEVKRNAEKRAPIRTLRRADDDITDEEAERLAREYRAAHKGDAA